MEKLDWMVTVNLWDTETSSFWQRPGVDPATIQTEVFMLPCAASVEKEGSITNSGRWAQWRYKAVEPPGEAKPDAWIVNQIMLRLRQLYADDPGPNPDPILNLAWDYGDGEVDAHQVAKEINGWAVADVKDKDGNVIVPAGKQVKNFTQLQADGSHRLRLLGLLRQLQRRRQHDGPAGQRRHPPAGPGPVRQLGLVLAHEPPHHLQPGLGHHGRRTDRPQARRHHLERRGQEVGRRRAGRRLAAGRAAALHHAPRRTRAGSSARPWPMVPSPSTTSRGKAR